MPRKKRSRRRKPDHESELQGASTRPCLPLLIFTVTVTFFFLGTTNTRVVKTLQTIFRSNQSQDSRRSLRPRSQSPSKATDSGKNPKPFHPLLKYYRFHTGSEDEDQRNGDGLKGLKVSSTHQDPSFLSSGATPDTGLPLLSDIPSGPFPLASLTSKSSAQAPTRSYFGALWLASFTHAFLGTRLPLYLEAELLHSGSRENNTDAGPSIFRVRQKGEWIGCLRPDHLICKGIYRALKMTNAHTVAMTSCDAATGWLPSILRKLRDEFRPIRLTCVVGMGGGQPTQMLKEVYGAIGLVDVIEADMVNQPLGENVRADMLIAYRPPALTTLIAGMKLFRNIKQSRGIRLLGVETFPEVHNANTTTHIGGGLRLNLGEAPFSFPEPVFEYGNEAENYDGVRAEIIAVKTSELFKASATMDVREIIAARKGAEEARQG